MFVGQIIPHAIFLVATGITIHICTEGLPLDHLRVAEGLSADRLGNAERLPDRRGIAFGLHKVAFGLPLVMA